jgi:hypothetical protein
MAQLFFNNARGFLDTAVTATDTTLRVAQPVGLPASLASGDWFLLTVYKDSRRYGEDHEVVKVTATSVDGVVLVCTVERGVEGDALPHVMGEPVEVRMTAGTATSVHKTQKNVRLMQLGIELL